MVSEPMPLEHPRGAVRLARVLESALPGRPAPDGVRLGRVPEQVALKCSELPEPELRQARQPAMLLDRLREGSASE